MHWIVQDGFTHEKGMVELIETLEKHDIPHTIVKVVPFVGDIIPDVSPVGNVICMGSYSLRHLAKRKNWWPGIIDMDEFSNILTYKSSSWTTHMLNRDKFFISSFENIVNVAKELELEEFFMRPVGDRKEFNGGVFTITEVEEWIHKVIDLGERENGTTLNGTTECLIAETKHIYAEYRLFIVNRRVITGSQYKLGGRVNYNSFVPENVLKFAQDRAYEAVEAHTYVLDVAVTPDALKIIEVNTLNSAGFYHSNTPKLVEVLERVYG